MYESKRAILDGRTHRYEITRDNAVLSFSETLGLWRDDAAFREFFLSVLSDAAFSAYRWETPPITLATAGRRFEFVLLDAPFLSLPPDTHTFADHFARDHGNTGVVVFDNLGGDATLVVPTPHIESVDYSHLAAFMRNAPGEQQHALLRTLGAAGRQRLDDRPVWISTAGGGVAWLHVRLDSRPKYYAHAPYRQFDSSS